PRPAVADRGTAAFPASPWGWWSCSAPHRTVQSVHYGRPRAGEVTLVALGLEPLGQLRAALLDDAPADEDVHEVRLHVAQDPGVVGDQQDAGLAGLGDAVHALAHHAQSVDVEAGVGLVEDRDLRPQQ